MKRITFYNYPEDKNDQSEELMRKRKPNEKKRRRSEKSVTTYILLCMGYDSLNNILVFVMYNLLAEKVLF